MIYVYKNIDMPGSCLVYVIQTLSYYFLFILFFLNFLFFLFFFFFEFTCLPHPDPPSHSYYFLKETV